MCHGDPNQVSGWFGSAIYLDGIDDCISILSPSALQYSSQITLSFWLKADPSYNTPNQAIISKGLRSWRIAFSSNPPGALVFSSGANTDNYPRVLGQTMVANTAWHHVAAINDGSKQSLYVDGTLDNSTPVEALVPLVLSRHPIMIGTDPGFKGPFYSGQIDDVALFSQALSAEQIQHLYQRGISSFLESLDPSVREAAMQERKMIQPRLREILPRIRRNDITGAEAETNRLLSDFANSSEIYPALHRIAEKYLRAETWDQALAISDYVLANSPHSQLTSLGARQTKVAALIQRGQEKEAQFVTEEILQNHSRHPYTVAVIARLAERWFKKQKYEKARQCYQIVLDIWPESEQAGHCQYMIARCYAKLISTGVVSETEAELQMQAAYQKVLTGYPDSPAARAAARESKKK